MSRHIFRLIAPFLILAALLVGLGPNHAAGQTAASATYSTYLPSLLAGSGDAPNPPSVPEAPPPGADDNGFTEVISARTPYSSLAVGEVDGRAVARISRYAEPSGYYDASTDSWLPINPQLVADGDGYRNSAAGFTAHFAQGGESGTLLQLGRADEPTLALSLPGARSVPAPIVGTTAITYPTALGAASLVYHSETWGVKEEVVIDAPGAPASYDLRLDAPGLSAERQADGGYLLRDAAGAALWRVPAPTGADAGGAPAPLSLSITPDGGSLLARLSVDAAWLADPARAYPVRLDPSLADPQYNPGDTYVQQNGGGGTWNHQNRSLGYINQPIALGGNKGITRIFTNIDLGVLPTGMSSSDLLSVRIVYTQYVRLSTTALDTSVFPVLIPWTADAIDWGNQPNGANLGPRVAQATLSPVNDKKRWDITAWARDVISGVRPNYGLTIRVDNESEAGRIFRSYGCYPAYCASTDRPYLEFDVLLDSGLNPALDTWAWPNREGVPSFEQYAKDYGVPATTHLVTETRVLQTLSYTDTLALPINLDAVGIRDTIPLSVTANLTSTEVISGTPAALIPRPISYLYEEVVVKAVYDDAFSAYYNAAMKGGLCVGMASTVADFYAEGGPDPAVYGGADTVRSIPDEAPAQEFIQTYHGRQLSSQVLNWMAGEGRMSVQTYYNRLAARIGGAAWRANPEIVGILKGTDCEDVEIGHALLPYKLVPLAGNRARVYVYDPNYPPTSADDAANHYIDLDMGAGTWSYELAPATATHPAVIWLGGELFSTPLSLITQKPIQPSASDSDIVALEGGQSYAFGGQSYAFGGHSYAFGTDEENNTHTGCVVSAGGTPTFAQNIARSIRVTPLSGGDTRTFPDTLFIPAGHAMAFTGVGAREGGVGDTMVFGPHSVMGYLTTAGASTRDVLNVDAPFRRAELSTSDPSKPASLYQIHETDAWTRVYALNNTSIDASASLISEVSADLGSLTVINPGQPRRYDLGLGHYGSDGVGQVLLPRLQIGANERRVYTPIVWEDVAHSPLMVEVDLGNDGTIDRSELIGGSVFPVVLSMAKAPTTIGAEFRLADRRLAPGHYGWADPFHPLPAPGQLPAVDTKDADLRHNDDGKGSNSGHDGERGDVIALIRRLTRSDSCRDGGSDHESERMCRAMARWLVYGGNPGLTVGDRLVGIPGTYTHLLKEVRRHSSAYPSIFRPGSLVLVPLYDQIRVERGRRVVYRIGGFALVEVLPDRRHNDHHDSGRGKRSDSRAQGGHEGDDDGSIRVRLVARIAP